MPSIKFSHSYVILTETKYIETPVSNVAYSDHVKALLKSKKAYSTDHELIPFEYVSRKVVVPELDPEELSWLLDDACVGFEAETMGSLTIEHGHLPAVSMEYFDYYTNQITQVYVSPVFEVVGSDDYEYVRGNNQIQSWLNQITEEYFDFLKDDNVNGLVDYLRDLEPFSFDPNQLELELS
jgi:hypothetical protein